MCTICGCNDPRAAVGGVPLAHDHRHAHAHDHAHDHGQGHGQDHAHDHGHGHEGHGADAADLRGARPGGARRITLEADLLAENAGFAAANRRRLRERRITAFNLMSGPGSGKTTLLEVTARALKDERPLAVIEGDQQTAHDAERIRATGVPAIQINTGKGCHLDAHMVGHALDALQPEPAALLFIENVGNLVCPAGFDLGEARRVVLLSVTEGDDKPLKYPDMFACADAVVLNKIDLLPYVDFDVARCLGYARRLRPEVVTFALSARSGDGLPAWLAWLQSCGEG